MHCLCIVYVYMHTHMHKLPHAVQPNVAHTISGQAQHMLLDNQFIAYLSVCGCTRHCVLVGLRLYTSTGPVASLKLRLSPCHPQGVNRLFQIFPIGQFHKLGLKRLLSPRVLPNGIQEIIKSALTYIGLRLPGYH